MTKIMLVEDDNNLREIYEARLAAEGYTIVSAQDGEAALALAAREHPDLVITDVMMPKISGFEMLDILRNTDALRNVKVIMLTALGQAEDNARANALGADRYLVKSQVTLEDIVKATHDVMADPQATPEPAAAPAEAAAPVLEASQEAPEPPAALYVDAPALAEPVPEAVDASLAEVIPEPMFQPSADEQYATPVQPIEVETYDTVPDNAEPHYDLPAVPDYMPSQAALSEVDASEVAQVPEVTQEAQVTDAPEAEIVPTSAATASEESETTAQEESVIRAQIDQFIGSSDTGQATADDSQASVVDNEVSADDAVGSTARLDDAAIPMTNVDEPSLPEEPESEFAKDDATPDMGELAVHYEPVNTETAATPAQTDQPEPASDETPVVASETQTYEMPQSPLPQEPQSQPVTEVAAADAVATPGYPSQPYQLPVNPEAAVETQAAGEPQSAGDQLVASAIDSMAASTPSPEPYSYAAQTTPAATPSLSQPPFPAPMQPQASSDQDTAATEPEAAADPCGVPAPVTHKRVITPIGLPTRPDINQLLAMEDAKAAAAQAAAFTAPAQQAMPQPQAYPQPAQPTQTAAPNEYVPTAGQDWQQPFQQAQQASQTNAYNHPPVDPNSISL